jgi:Outer membrane protein beta-barrel family
LWTLSLSKQILKDNRGELKLTVFDVLDKNISVNRSVSDTYVEDQQFNVLKRYFMLTFTYNLKSFGQQPGMPNMPPGMRMPMIRM